MPTILIVDDVKINAMVVSKVLEEIAPNHVFATNGIEALEIFEAQDGIDLILMDIPYAADEWSGGY
jgi:CheY-like chemotaxis protein